MYNEYWICGKISKKISMTVIRKLNSRSWGIDENDALQKLLTSGEFKNYNEKEFVATVRILPTGRKKNTLKGGTVPFITVPRDYNPQQKQTLSYYCIRIPHAETISEVKELHYHFKMNDRVLDLTKEHQNYLHNGMLKRSELILAGEIKPYIYSLSHGVPNEWSSDKKFVHYLKKSVNNLRLSGYRIEKNEDKFKVTGSRWIQHIFPEPLSENLLPVEVILYWEHIAPFYKEVNNHVDVLPDSHEASVIHYLGMQSPDNLDPYFKQLKKEQIKYWLLITDNEMTSINILQDDYLKAKEALRNIKPDLFYSIDDLFDDLLNSSSDYGGNIDKNGNLTEAFWESYE